jgi:hypothetical protein
MHSTEGEDAMAAHQFSVLGSGPCGAATHPGGSPDPGEEADDRAHCGRDGAFAGPSAGDGSDEPHVGTEAGAEPRAAVMERS